MCVCVRGVVVGIDWLSSYSSLEEWYRGTPGSMDGGMYVVVMGGLRGSLCYCCLVGMDLLITCRFVGLVRLERRFVRSVLFPSPP